MAGLRGVGWASRPSRAVLWVESKASVSQESPTMWGWFWAEKGFPPRHPWPCTGLQTRDQREWETSGEKKTPP